jgi:hypothetical protein
MQKTPDTPENAQHAPEEAPNISMSFESRLGVTFTESAL